MRSLSLFTRRHLAHYGEYAERVLIVLCAQEIYIESPPF